MRRGDVVVVAVRGPYSGKPRPAAVVQSDLFNPTHPSVTVAPITSHEADAPLFRIPVDPSEANGLKRRSWVMIDKLFAAPRDAVSDVSGVLETAVLDEVDAALRRWLSV